MRDILRQKVFLEKMVFRENANIYPQKFQILVAKMSRPQKDGHSAWPVDGIFKKAYVLFDFCVWSMRL